METSVLNPVPEKEFERIVELSVLDIDYSDLNHSLKDLAKLAAKVAGTEICLINLIDSFTQWTVSSYGLEINQMPREEGICQYTILDEDVFEVEDLGKDKRFKGRKYVAYPPGIKYYFGLPLITSKGLKVGTLCLLDTSHKAVSPEKAELLKIISGEVVERLETSKNIKKLQFDLAAENDSKRKLNHDIRGPIGGILGLIQLIKDEIPEAEENDFNRYLDLIENAGNNLRNIANERLSSGNQKGERKLRDQEFNLITLKQKLLELYLPQAQNKSIDLTIANHPQYEELPFPKNNVLQILGNIISNVIQFTLQDEMIMIRQEYKHASKSNYLLITIKNTSSELTNNRIRQIYNDDADSELKATALNLRVVQYMLTKVGGNFSISDEGDRGNRFDIELPVNLTKK